MLASGLGVKPEFVEGKWDGLIAGVDAKRYDLVLNEVAITQERLKKYDFSDPYITSKAGAIGLTPSMAIDPAPRGIFVNAIAPGLIETEMFRSLTPERQRELIDKQPTKEVGQPEDIANGIAFFASPRTRNVTGQILTLDGGRSMGVSIY